MPMKGFFNKLKEFITYRPVFQKCSVVSYGQKKMISERKSHPSTQ